MTKKTTVAKEKHMLKLENKQSVEHSGIVNLLWRRLDVQVPESKVILGGVEIFKD